MVLRLSKRTLIVATLLGSATSLGCATSALAADPTGDWQVEGGFANMRVAECGGAMWGVVAWEKKPGGVDNKNPDPAKQTRPTLGMVSLFDMKKKPNADVWEGEVYDSQTTGRRWSASLTPKGTNQLRIEGCALGFMCSGQDWTRVAPPIPSSPTNANASANPRVMPKGAGPTTTTPTAAPHTAAAPKSGGPKTAATAPGQTADIGDICLLPEIKSAIAARAPAR